MVVQVPLPVAPELLLELLPEELLEELLDELLDELLEELLLEPLSLPPPQPPMKAAPTAPPSRPSAARRVSGFLVSPSMLAAMVSDDWCTISRPVIAVDAGAADALCVVRAPP